MMFFLPKNLKTGHSCLKIEQEPFVVVPSTAEIFCLVFNSSGNTQILFSCL